MDTDSRPFSSASTLVSADDSVVVSVSACQRVSPASEAIELHSHRGQTESLPWPFRQTLRHGRCWLAIRFKQTPSTGSAIWTSSSCGLADMEPTVAIHWTRRSNVLDSRYEWHQHPKTTVCCVTGSDLKNRLERICRFVVDKSGVKSIMRHIRSAFLLLHWTNQHPIHILSHQLVSGQKSNLLENGGQETGSMWTHRPKFAFLEKFDSYARYSGLIIEPTES